MGIKFTLTEIIKDFTHIEDKYGYVEIEKKYEVDNWDDIQNLFLTLLDFSTDELHIKVKKEIIEEVAE